MGVLVKMHNGDREQFDTANTFGALPDGQLVVSSPDSHQPVALFAPGSWAAVFEVSPRRPAATVPKASSNIHVTVDGKELRKVAAAETNSALGRLADSIEKSG